MANMTYAFDTVLDRAIEAEKKVAVLEERNRSGDYQAEILRRDLNNARSDLTTAKVALKKFEDAGDTLATLYGAIDAAVMRLSAIKTDEEIALVDSLKTSTAAAKKFIDPIPF